MTQTEENQERYRIKLNNLKHRYLTQRELSEALQIHPSRLSKLLNGLATIGAKTIKRIETLELALKPTTQESKEQLQVLFPQKTDVPYYTTQHSTTGEPVVEYGSTLARLNLQDRFVVEVSDGSLADVGIEAGDMVLFRRSSEPSEGDIVIVRVGDTYNIRILKSGQYYNPADLVDVAIAASEVAEVVGVGEFRIERLIKIKR